MVTDNLAGCKAIIRAPLKKVWDALTVPEIVKQYFFGANQQSSYKPGDAITWDGEFQGQKYRDKGKILDCVPLKKLSYSYFSSWSGKEDKPENYLWVEYELKDMGNQPHLTIMFSSYDEERAQHSADNWKKIIEDLKKVIE